MYIDCTEREGRMKHQPVGMTMKEFWLWKAKAYAKDDIEKNRKKFWRNQPIGEAEIAYLKNVMEAPDVSQFIALV